MPPFDEEAGHSGEKLCLQAWNRQNDAPEQFYIKIGLAYKLSNLEKSKQLLANSCQLTAFITKKCITTPAFKRAIHIYKQRH
jgi:hypothetical protein